MNPVVYSPRFTVESCLRIPVQKFIDFCRKIYEIFLSIIDILKRILCGCCSAKREVKRYADEISNGLALFDHPGIENQINGIYVTTNETNWPATLHQLRQQREQQMRPKIHIGCASWHNLDMMCTRRPAYGLIFDFNPKNAEFMKKTAELIHSCESREDFVAAVIRYLNSLTGSERDVFFHRDQRGSLIERIQGELSREGSWLQSEENYLYMKREIVAKGRLVPITEDMRNVEKIRSIREFLDRNGIVIDTLYTSNICDFMNTSEDRDAFMRSIRHWLHEDSIWIHSPSLHQRTISGREVLSNSCGIL